MAKKKLNTRTSKLRLILQILGLVMAFSGIAALILFLLFGTVTLTIILACGAMVVIGLVLMGSEEGWNNIMGGLFIWPGK
jgi:hypothetical protein